MKEQLFEIAFLKERIAEYRNWEAKIKDVKECKESQIIEEVEKSNEEDVRSDFNFLMMTWMLFMCTTIILLLYKKHAHKILH